MITLRSLFNSIVDFDLTWLLGLVILIVSIWFVRLVHITLGPDLHALFHYDLARLWRKSP